LYKKHGARDGVSVLLMRSLLSIQLAQFRYTLVPARIYRARSLCYLDFKVLKMPAKPTIYLIRHGEKPGHGLNGLNAAGVARAEALVHVFKAGAEFNIKHIIAQKPKQSGKRGRPRETVEPLAKSLGLTVDISREREEVKEVASDVLKYIKEDAAGDVLICWEHKRLRDIATAFGVKHAPDYDDQRFDLLWKLEDPYDALYVTSYSIADSPGKTEWAKAG
jgi:hypothetical protein